MDKAVKRSGPEENSPLQLRRRSDVQSSKYHISATSAFAKWDRGNKIKGQRPSVQFPCSLHSSSPLQLSDKSTMFFVLKPQDIGLKNGDNHV